MPIVKRDKPAISAWIIDRRKAMNLKPDSLARELTRLGYEVKEATVRGWEAGARPGEAGIRTLERLFASEAPSEEEAPAADLGALVAALTRQTEAMEERNRIDRDILKALELRMDGAEFRLGRVEEGQVGLTRELADEIARLERLVPGAGPADTAFGDSGSGAAGRSVRR